MMLFPVSLIAGFLTVLTPCILPLVPLVVGHTMSGVSRRRAAVVTVSLAASIVAFTLLLKASTAFVDVPASAWKLLSGALMAVLGALQLVPQLWDRIPFVEALGRRSNMALGAAYRKRDMAGDVMMGVALGPVFSSCSPTYFVILAAVLPARPAAGTAYLAAYAVGLVTALLLVGLAGERLLRRLGIAADPNGPVRKAFGVALVLIGISILTGADKAIERSLLETGAYQGLASFERQLLGGAESEL